MASGVFLIQKDETLVAMSEQSYDTEDVLQVLLAKYPDLLAGDQMDSTEPRRWLLISRESPIPADESGWQYALDHLFVDQDGVPTFVEVKRASDTRTRREVVAQMLDYAANANAYGPSKPLAEQFEERCQADGLDPDREISDRLGAEVEPQDLWERVDTNLSAGKMRLVFVADSIPLSLRRIVEFLNVQMRETHVVAVEIKQFVGEGLRTLVPKVIGQTEEARARKSNAAPGRVWDEEAFFQALADRSPDTVPPARRIYEWAKDRMPPRWGRGRSQGSFSVGLNHEGVWYPAVNVWTDGSIGFPFDHMRGKPPFDGVATRLEFLRRLNEIPALSLDEDVAGEKPKMPAVKLAPLADGGGLEKLFEALEWFMRTVRESR